MPRRRTQAHQHDSGSCGCGGACTACSARPAVEAALTAAATLDALLAAEPFTHHVGDDVDPSGCVLAIGFLNVGYGGDSRQALYDHLASHLTEASQDVPALASSLAVGEAFSGLIEELVAAGAHFGDDAVISFADGTADDAAERLRGLAGQAASLASIIVGDDHAADFVDSAVEWFTESGRHGSFDGTHSHEHATMGAQGEDATHDHEHSHSNDASHDHEHATTAAAPPADVPTLPHAELGRLGIPLTQWGYLPSAISTERDRLRDEAVDAAIAVVERAHARAGTVTAAAGDVEDRWHAYIFVEGLRTTDNRAVALGATSWRDLPLPLEWARSYEGGHYGKVVVGAIETIEKIDGPMGITLLYAEGPWDLESEDGAECARQVALQGGTRWVSADVEVLKSHIESSGGGDVDFMDILFGDADDEWYDVLDEGRVMGATVLSTPAFPQCCIAPLSVELPVVEPTQDTPDIVPGLVASAAAYRPAPARPPATWFDNPGFSRGDSRLVEVKDRTGRVFRGCPVAFDDDGAVYGHIALWGFCHTGFPGECVLAPHSPTDYAYFRTGEVVCEGGEHIPVGQLTIGTKHADGHLRHLEAARHYDLTGFAVADVASGEDEFGIWIAGARRPDVTDEQLRAARASSPSGDWRLVGGAMDMVAVLDVNVPGFPVPRSIAASLVAAGAPADYHPGATVYYEGYGTERRAVSLVAAGRMPRNPLAELVAGVRSELAAMRADVAALAPLRERFEAEERAARLDALQARIA